MRLPKNWPAIRAAARERAGHRSSRSGSAGRLEVHHRDGDRTNNSPENLEVLTRKEHLLEHHQTRSQTERPGRFSWRNRSMRKSIAASIRISARSATALVELDAYRDAKHRAGVRADSR